MEKEQKLAQIQRGKEIQKRRKFYREREIQMVEYANLRGVGEAMEKFKYDGRPITLTTLQKYIQRRKKVDERTPYVHNRAMYKDGESYGESIIKGILKTIEKFENTVAELEDQISKKDAVIEEKEEIIKNLKDEKNIWGSLFRGKEDTLMQDLLNKIK